MECDEWDDDADGDDLPNDWELERGFDPWIRMTSSAVTERRSTA
ncbi:MAG: hypothetical protein Ct9H90mP24_6180 [Methanobacteriota archaeon]|nr:MAG: hypothetical protein Ct9H90mP24_6180 [Euryarchaeota archaeon]